MAGDLIIVNEKMVIPAGIDNLDQSFTNIPDNKQAVIELVSFRITEHGSSSSIPAPLQLWAFPASSGPPHTKSVFLPILGGIHAPQIFAGTHDIRFRLEPGDAWGVSFRRQATSNQIDIEMYISGLLVD